MSEDIKHKCQWKKCGSPSDIIYLGVGLCDKHWTKACDMPLEQVYKILGIEKQDEDKTGVCEQ